MLETIGELARERLEASGEAEAIGRRHADYFLDMAEQSVPALKGPNQPSCFNGWRTSTTTSGRSLEWLFDHENELAPKLAGELWMFWYMHGHVSEARRWLRRALDVCPDEPSELRANVLYGAGYLALEQNENEEGLALPRGGLACAKELGASATAALAAATLGAFRAEARSSASDRREAIAVGEEAVALARAGGDDFTLATVLNNVAEVMVIIGEKGTGTAYYEESLELRRRIGDVSRIALSLYNLAEMSLIEGRIDRAAALFAEAAEIAGGIGDKRHVCFAQGGLGWVAYLERRWEDADRHARASLRLARELGHRLQMVAEISCLAGSPRPRGKRSGRHALPRRRSSTNCAAHRTCSRTPAITKRTSKELRPPATRRPGSAPGQLEWQ